MSAHNKGGGHAVAAKVDQLPEVREPAKVPDDMCCVSVWLQIQVRMWGYPAAEFLSYFSIPDTQLGKTSPTSDLYYFTN